MVYLTLILKQVHHFVPGHQLPFVNAWVQVDHLESALVSEPSLRSRISSAVGFALLFNLEPLSQCSLVPCANLPENGSEVSWSLRLLRCQAFKGEEENLSPFSGSNREASLQRVIICPPFAEWKVLLK